MSLDVHALAVLLTAPHDTSAEFAWLWRIYLWVVVGVGLLVAATIAFAAVRFRRRSDDWPPQRRGAPRLEAAYLAVIAVIVVALLVATFHTENQEDALAGTPALRIAVTASQWQWRFGYPSGRVAAAGSNTAAAHPRYATLTVPAGEPVEFSLRSLDVLHSFFIPAMRFKRYAFPGSINRFVLTFPHPGRLLGQCAQFCGWDHAEMRFNVVVLPAARFRAWLHSSRTGAAT
jgi:cytochrome c oxidase subunit II